MPRGEWVLTGRDATAPGGRPEDAAAGEAIHPVDRRCQQLVDELRQAAPDVLPAKALRPGRTAPPVELDSRTVAELMRLVLAPARGKTRVVWQDSDSEVLVHLGRTRVEVLDGVILVAMTLECDETGLKELVVPLALGSPERSAGLVAVAEAKPRGDPLLVDRWGDAVIAAAWQTLLEVATRLAGRLGTDTAGEPLGVGALVAGRGKLSVVAQAEHAYRRRAVR